MVVLSRFTFALLLLIVCVTSTLVRPQSTNQTDSELIKLTVTVRARSDNYVADLTRDAFRIVDEKTPRTVDLFEGVDTPASIGVLIDTSGSMMVLKEFATEAELEKAILHLFRSDRENEYFLATFDKEVRFITSFERGSALLAQKINIMVGAKNTAIYDSCFAALERLQTGRYSKKVLIVVSDGQDDQSQRTFRQLIKFLKSSDITVYSIAVKNPRTADSLEADGASILQELAEITGGRSFPVDDKKKLAGATYQIADELRNQYRVGFRPNHQDLRDKWHRLEVKVVPLSGVQPESSKLSVRTRQGYYTR